MNMKRFRLRLSSLLWVVAVAAAFLGGVRYGEYREAARGGKPTYRAYKTIWVSPDEAATWKVETYRAKPRTKP
jgi:hypothetical protein